MSAKDTEPEFADGMAKRHHDMWSEYLGGASGVRELVMADMRSVHPGLWNDRWELPYPFVRHRPAFLLKSTEDAHPVIAVQEVIEELQKARDHIRDLRIKLFRFYNTPSLVLLQSHEKRRSRDRVANPDVV